MVFALRASALLGSRCAQTAHRVVAPVAAGLRPSCRGLATHTVPRASPNETQAKSDYGANEIIFNPIKEGQEAIEKVAEAELNSQLPEESFARLNYAFESEAAVNQQINHEYTMSYMYHQMSSYFNHSNTALPGFAQFFRISSLEERTHAQQLMDFQATRGGRTKLAAIMAPETDYQHEEKGDALHAMELALALEKLNFQMLMDLHEVADRQNDAQMSDFVETMMEEQAEGVKVVADFTAQLRRIGKGFPVLQFDRDIMVPAAEAMQAEITPHLF